MLSIFPRLSIPSCLLVCSPHSLAWDCACCKIEFVLYITTDPIGPFRNLSGSVSCDRQTLRFGPRNFVNNPLIDKRSTLNFYSVDLEKRGEPGRVIFPLLFISVSTRSPLLRPFLYSG